MKETVVERLDDCPKSSAVGLALIEGVVRVGLTMIVAKLEVTLTGEAELSVI